MRIVHVIPIVRGLSKETLSYFSTLPVSLGALVEVGVRKRNIPAVVTSIQEIGTVRSEIKSLPFGMRKIEKILSPDFFSENFMRSASRMADYFATTTGEVLSALTPVFIFKNPEKRGKMGESKKIGSSEKGEIFIFQGEEEKRLGEYKTLIREEFARGHSVYVCAPTIEDTKKCFSLLSRGIESNAYLLHSKVKAKELQRKFSDASENKHPILIVATGTFFALPRNDIGTIIVEKEASRAYRSKKQPFLDIRVFAELFASESRSRLILSDTLLRTETLAREEEGEVAELTPLQWKLFTRESELVIDMKKEGVLKEKNFAVLGKKLIGLIESAKEKHLHILLFSVRKGFAPTVVCQDCGSAIKCKKCHSPVVFYKKNGNDENVLLCQKCKTVRNADEECENCKSWRLLPLGIGVDRVEEEARKFIPKEHIHVFDKDTIKTVTEAEREIKRFTEAPWGILIATEMALPYLKEKVDHAAVVSIDPLFSIPDFRMNERIMSILLKIRAITAGSFLIQTRQSDEPVLSFAKEGNIIDFYRSELAERRKYNYPPQSVLIKISLSGERHAVEEAMEKLRTLLINYTPEIFPSVSADRSRFTSNALLRVKREKWPLMPLVEALRNLPRFFRIEIDPETLL